MAVFIAIAAFLLSATHFLNLVRSCSTPKGHSSLLSVHRLCSSIKTFAYTSAFFWFLVLVKISFLLKYSLFTIISIKSFSRVLLHCAFLPGLPLLFCLLSCTARPYSTSSTSLSSILLSSPSLINKKNLHLLYSKQKLINHWVLDKLLRADETFSR